MASSFREALSVCTRKDYHSGDRGYEIIGNEGSLRISKPVPSATDTVSRVNTSRWLSALVIAFAELAFEVFSYYFL